MSWVCCQYVLAQPHSLLEAGKVRLNGREIGEFSFKRIAPEYPYAIWMPQPIFLDALLRKARAVSVLQVLDGRQGDRSSWRKTAAWSA